MTGENDGGWLVPSSTQPGGRPPAPGGLGLVQAFINSHYDLEVDHGADLLATPRELRRWLRAHRLIEPRVRVGRGDLQRALSVREGLRELARGNGVRPPIDGSPDEEALIDAARALNTAGTGAGVEVRFSPRGARFVRAQDAGVGGALGLVLALAARAMIDGSWPRLKVCPGDDCGWAFYDHSRNQTSRWCSMSVCGGRAKARSHYRRHRGEAM